MKYTLMASTQVRPAKQRGKGFPSLMPYDPDNSDHNTVQISHVFHRMLAVGIKKWGVKYFMSYSVTLIISPVDIILSLEGSARPL